VDEERAARETIPPSADGICVECGALIPHERLAVTPDAFRCDECVRSYGVVRDPGVEHLEKTA
jgi:RNA polymerase-binding transcription factor DksA